MVCYDVTTMLSVRNSNIRRNFVFGVTFICLFIYLLFVTFEFIHEIYWNILRLYLCDFY